MTYKELKYKIKEEQKTLAQKIKNGKSGRKPKNRTSDNMTDYESLCWSREDYRHRHIIYCQMFNNTPYDSIEQPRAEHIPDTYQLEKIQKNWENEIDEALRDCA